MGPAQRFRPEGADPPAPSPGLLGEADVLAVGHHVGGVGEGLPVSAGSVADPSQTVEALGSSGDLLMCRGGVEEDLDVPGKGCDVCGGEDRVGCLLLDAVHALDGAVLVEGLLLIVDVSVAGGAEVAFVVGLGHGCLLSQGLWGSWPRFVDGCILGPLRPMASLNHTKIRQKWHIRHSKCRKCLPRRALGKYGPRHTETETQAGPQEPSSAGPGHSTAPTGETIGLGVRREGLDIHAAGIVSGDRLGWAGRGVPQVCREGLSGRRKERATHTKNSSRGATGGDRTER